MSITRQAIQDLLVRALLIGRRPTRLFSGSRLGGQDRDANILTRLDVVQIVQRRVKLMDLLQKLRRAAAVFLDANAEQGLPCRYTNGADRIERLRSSLCNQ